MTQHYWERSPSSLTKTMRLPWLQQPPTTDHLPSENTADQEPGDEDEEVVDAFVMLLERNRALRRRLAS